MIPSEQGAIDPPPISHASRVVHDPALLAEHLEVQPEQPIAKGSRFRRSPLPGFVPGLSVTVSYLTVLLLLPLAACAVKVSSLTVSEFIAAVWSARARAAYWVTFETSVIAALLNVAAGLLLAWVLVRYQFPGRRLMDALIDLPFALPTAVAGLVFSALYVEQGWYGQFLVPLGVKVAYTRLGIIMVIVFVGLPFVVRTIQPVLESLDKDIEEASASLGASRWQTFRMVLFPSLWPAILTGFALSFARGLGEYGAVVFVSGNMPFKTEIAPVLIVARLEQFAYAEATAIALVLVAGSLLSLAAINWLERRSQRYAN
ncbi:sulfate ABC transporter permease subunit CysT [Planctomicrobium sp. SH661]|uniref:sulfate ABC transporter permease subunit CysT n=1 Tax=Planctomicrobium sp. SH661 TaxID=3448124 RepID=UPI003F5C69D8